MSTVDDAVEAGGRAQYDPVAGTSHEYRVGPTGRVSYCSCGWKASASHAVAEYDDHVSRLVLAAAWPILSAPLRELHTEDWSCGNPRHTNPDVGCPDCGVHCGHCGHDWPCPTVQAIDETDKELGLT